MHNYYFCYLNNRRKWWRICNALGILAKFVSNVKPFVSDFLPPCLTFRPLTQMCFKSDSFMWNKIICQYDRKFYRLKSINIVLQFPLSYLFELSHKTHTLQTMHGRYFVIQCLQWICISNTCINNNKLWGGCLTFLGWGAIIIIK